MDNVKDTIPQDTIDTWIEYKSSLEKREKKKKEQLKDKYELYLSFAFSIAELLYKKYTVEKVYLIGSLLDFTWFHKHSDIDIAVKGLDPMKYFQAFIGIGAKELD